MLFQSTENVLARFTDLDLWLLWIRINLRNDESF